MGVCVQSIASKISVGQLVTLYGCAPVVSPRALLHGRMSIAGVLVVSFMCHLPCPVWSGLLQLATAPCPKLKGVLLSHRCCGTQRQMDIRLF